METYFHGNSSQPLNQLNHAAAAATGSGGGGGLQTLILMNPSTTTSSDYNNNNNNNSKNFVFRNSFNAPPSSQLLDGIPLPSSAVVADSSEDRQNDNISLLHGFLPRLHFNTTNHYNNKFDHMEARETPRVQRGLSLSLSSQLSAAYGAKRELPPPSLIDDMRGNYMSPPGISNNINNHVLLSSKHIKAVQQLLDELVNVSIPEPPPPPPSKSVTSGGGEGGRGCDNGGKHGGGELLTTAEKQEIQMKKSKLVNMLDEVEQRYRQYRQQMQMVETMFEQVCGLGSAKAYTALALQTISKQFRSIKDAILCQVRIASKSLGEEEGEEDSNIKGSSSRMKNIDNQMRQQRALQQLGMVHHNAWRPQRGLPERSVSVLRSWLFEHFLHPYPKDSDKIMLAKQAGLTRGQVCNWFINARVRLWKPMVEEMYSEEMKQKENKTASDEEESGNKSEHTTTFDTHPENISTVVENQNNGFDVLNQDFQINHQNITNSPVSISSTSQARTHMQNQTGNNFDFIGSPEMESISKRQRCNDMFGHPTGASNMDTEKLDESANEHLSRREDGFTLFGGGPTTHFINGGFNPIAELGRFNNNDQQFPSPYSATNNGVSLSLGLPHCENLAMSGPNHQTFELARGVEDIGDAREFGSIQHRVIVPEYMRESTFRNTRGLMDNYYQTL